VGVNQGLGKSSGSTIVTEPEPAGKSVPPAMSAADAPGPLASIARRDEWHKADAHDLLRERFLALLVQVAVVLAEPAGRDR
jgi:hypothetical protein